MHGKKAALCPETVRKETALPCLHDHNGWMPSKVGKKELDRAMRASVLREMAKPRMSSSARIAQRALDSERTPAPPQTTMPGTVDKVIPSIPPRQPEKVQIAVHPSGLRVRRIRIENSLLDENGNDVKLKKGAHVEVTVAAQPKR